MRHSASPEFWACYHILPKPIQELADGVLWFWIGTHADYDRLIS